GRLRIAFTTAAWNGSAVHAECVAAVNAAAKLCEALGHHVEEGRPEWDEAARAAASRIITSAHTRATLEARAAALGRPVTGQDVEPLTWAMAEYGRQVSADAYARAIPVMHRIGRIVGQFFTRYDMLLTPTMAQPPHKLGVLSLSNPDASAYLQAILGTIAFTSPFNSAGNPAMSVPLHWSRDGLPIGVQFVAPFGDEAGLIRLAAQLEAAQPWFDRRPPVHGA
ncbi:MAG TPA: amidase family protein, partial [Candidatus Sulfotelmatobacter sp.]|nr:amidase family protein [Candidatus Sulfotelmatobacter sp.]